MRNQIVKTLTHSLAVYLNHAQIISEVPQILMNVNPYAHFYPVKWPQ